MMGEDATELAFPEYWNRRYTEEEGKQDSYDWFRNWEHLEAWFKNHLSRSNARILHLGCGNSVSICTLHVSWTWQSFYCSINISGYRPQKATLFGLKCFAKPLLKSTCRAVISEILDIFMSFSPFNFFAFHLS